MKRIAILSLVIMIATTCLLSGCTEKEEAESKYTPEIYNLSLGDVLERNGQELSIDSVSNGTAIIRYTSNGTEYIRRILGGHNITWGNGSLKFIGSNLSEGGLPVVTFVLNRSEEES